MHIHEPADVPKGEHWAIIQSGSIYIPGDERSRTNPGHGYPARTEKYLLYDAFTDKTEFETELTKRLKRNEHVCGIHVKGTIEARLEYVLTQV